MEETEKNLQARLTLAETLRRRYDGEPPFEFPSMQSIYERQASEVERLSRPATIQQLGEHAFLRMHLTAGVPKRIDTLPIAERGGKVRVASLHPAEEITVARRLTQLWMPILRRLRSVRRSLQRGAVESYKLKRRQGDVVYSADLSAATDYVPHTVARCAARELALATDMKGGWLPILDDLFGPKDTDSGAGRTCNGIHMGLGPTWTVLCILNCFAAEYAGAAPGSYQVCGDDLVASWPESVCDRYEQTLERLGLKVNRSKSFRGLRGVFCERPVRIDGKFIIVDVANKLSALTASRFAADRSRSALGISQDLAKVQGGTEGLIARESCSRLLRSRRNNPGSVRIGGRGTGAPTKGRLAALSMRRPRAYTRRTANTERREMFTELDACSEDTQPKGDTVDIREARLQIATACDYVEATRGRRTKVKRVTVKQHNRSYVSARLSNEEIVSNAREKLLLPSKQVRIVRRLVKRKDKKSRKWLAQVLCRPSTTRYVLQTDVCRIIREVLKFEWDSQTRVRSAGDMPDAEVNK
jgi:hypothetical protein